MSSFRSQSIAVVCGIVTFCLATNPARAEVLFDNLAAPNPNGATYVQNGQWTAQKFSTTATSAELSEVSLRLWNMNSTTGGYEISVWDATGVAGSPGSQVGSAIYAGLAENLSTDSSNLLTLTGLSLALNPSTSYFIVAVGNTLTGIPTRPGRPDAPGSLAWNMTDTNPSGAYDGGPSVWAGPYSQNFYMKVEAVPEPSTYAMALAGLAYGGFSMWRRRKRA